MTLDLEDKAEPTSNPLTSMLTVTEVAHLLHCHPNTVRRWTNRKFIRAYFINTRGDRRYLRGDILDFLHLLEAQRGNPRKAN